jgi:hypothetical protein
MFILIGCVHAMDYEYIIDEKVCKHWALAGAMQGFVSQWELNAMTKFPLGACFIPSLQYVKCCGSVDMYDLSEHIWEPSCCINSPTCCQPITDSYATSMDDDNNTNIIRKSQIRYILPKLEDNPHPEYFDESFTITGRDMVILCVVGGVFVTLVISLFIIIDKWNKMELD